MSDYARRPHAGDVEAVKLVCGTETSLTPHDVAERVRIVEPRWWGRARSAFLALSALGPTEPYDCEECGVPEPGHPAWWGALVSHLYAAGQIVPVGESQTRRPGRRDLTRRWVRTEVRA